MKAIELTKRAEVIFKQIQNLDSHEYSLFVQNLELLKMKYFRSKHKDANVELLEDASMTFRELISDND